MKPRQCTDYQCNGRYALTIPGSFVPAKLGDCDSDRHDKQDGKDVTECRE